MQHMYLINMLLKYHYYDRIEIHAEIHAEIPVATSIFWWLYSLMSTLERAMQYSYTHIYMQSRITRHFFCRLATLCSMKQVFICYSS
jgi:hypothetical protein